METVMTYRTRDMALCAYLLLEGFSYDSVEKVSDRHAEMIFPETAELNEAVAEYRTGNADVEPREYQRKIGFVRGVLLDACRGNN